MSDGAITNLGSGLSRRRWVRSLTLILGRPNLTTNAIGKHVPQALARRGYPGAAAQQPTTALLKLSEALRIRIAPTHARAISLV